MVGEPVWKRDDFGKMMTRNEFGEGSSPTIVELFLRGEKNLYCIAK